MQVVVNEYPEDLSPNLWDIVLGMEEPSCFLLLWLHGRYFGKIWIGPEFGTELLQVFMQFLRLGGVKQPEDEEFSAGLRSKQYSPLLIK